MGQTIEVLGIKRLDTVLVIDTDRTLGGQDGESFDRGSEPSSTFASGLASELFGGDELIDHVFVASNTVTLRRSGDWDQGKADAAAGRVSRFFRHYPE